MAVLETILPADFYVRLLPDAYAAGDFSALDAGAELFCEEHFKVIPLASVLDTP